MTLRLIEILHQTSFAGGRLPVMVSNAIKSQEMGHAVGTNPAGLWKIPATMWALAVWALETTVFITHTTQAVGLG